MGDHSDLGCAISVAVLILLNFPNVKHSSNSHVGSTEKKNPLTNTQMYFLEDI